MSDRSDRIPLPPSEPRCEPSRGCTVRSQCARAQASIPQGSPLSDWTAVPGPQTPLCSGYLRTQQVLADARFRPAEQRPVKPWPGA